MRLAIARARLKLARLIEPRDLAALLTDEERDIAFEMAMDRGPDFDHRDVRRVVEREVLEDLVATPRDRWGEITFDDDMEEGA